MNQVVFMVACSKQVIQPPEHQKARLKGLGALQWCKSPCLWAGRVTLGLPSSGG